MFRNLRRSLSIAFPILALVVIGSAQDGKTTQESAKEQTSMPLEKMVDEVLSQPTLVNQSFYYDDGFRAVGSFSIHDHFAKRMCMGYLVSDGKKLAYRYIRAMPGLGSSNDAFETEIKNLSRVEYKFYQASKGMLDYYPERLSVKFYFESPVVGLLANWKKEDMKFDIWDVRFGRKMMEFIKAAGIPAVEKD